MLSSNLDEASASLAGLIDHTLLKADATRAEVLQVCREALQYGFAAVCVNSYWVQIVSEMLYGNPVRTCAVIGFPLGASSTAAKVGEAEAALLAGAQELDMVLNIGALKSNDDEQVRADIAAIVEPAHRAGALVKVILETALLDHHQKVKACRLAQEAHADFVKTSTGFGPSGATVADVQLLRATVGPRMGVKASGGIRTREQLQAMLQAGATRIGASAGVAIVQAGC